MQATEQRYNNQGAYIVLNPPDYSTPVFRSFEAVRPRPKVQHSFYINQSGLSFACFTFFLCKSNYGQIQVNAYYDFEEVIDSDEELDLKSMDNGSFHQANSSMSD